MVLIVDDSCDIARGLAMYLRREDVTTRCAYSVKEARALIAELKPKLLILDDFMPETNGLELLAWVRTQPELAAIPVVFHSANPDAERRAEASRLGAIRWFTKGDHAWGEIETYVRKLLAVPA